MRVHFIAIGGSVMHNLAIALAQKGYDVSGSDDEIFEPAKSNLHRYHLLPQKTGWNTANITSNLDAIVLGMHARSDNPELLKAKRLGLPIFSFPEFLYEQSKNKKRVVIAGSHGKTSITAMIMHMLKKNGRDFDYMVGSAVKGFDITVRLSDAAPVMIFEGDEYPDSALHMTPKFILYQPDIALISGIAWDHINVFPTFDSYVLQFRKFVGLIPATGALIYNEDDPVVKQLALTSNPATKKIPYTLPEYEIEAGRTSLVTGNEKVPLRIFGRHNLQNMMGASAVCQCLGVPLEQCFAAMQDFDGAARRLELIKASNTASIFRDFAHAPSKLKATIAATKEQYATRRLFACFELHTFSSLNKGFLSEYRHSMTDADVKVVFCNAHTLELKRMAPLEKHFIKDSFGDKGIHVFTDTDELKQFLESQDWHQANLLLMSSGNFGGLDLNEIANFVCSHS